MRLSKPFFTSCSLLVLLAFSAGCKIPTFGYGDREIASDWKPSWPFSRKEAPSGNETSEHKAEKGALRFSPSDVAKFDFRGAEDLVLPAGTCALDGDRDALECGSAKAPLVKATLSDGTEIAVLVVRSLTVPGAATLELAGGHPLAIVAKGRVVVQGSIVPGEHARAAYAGGGVPAGKKGGGPGGGTAGAGGSFCGKGGPAAGSGLGRTYGAATLKPLVAGSAGGGSSPGGGGGALHIAAGERIQVTLTGAIHLDGKDATTISGLTSGGGSGGALLLEAPEVRVDGALTANGGSGDGGGAGAAGASGDRVDGKAGEARNGGGGGAGRIRILTRTGKATLGADAVVSPALTTPCASQGKLGG
jgi:hypothetical protein